MLREISFLRQNGALRKKRWFTDSDMDLFVWFTRQVPVRFQLSYNKRDREHAINWNSETGFSHNRVDSGETYPDNYKMSPILLKDGKFDATDTARKFLMASEDIDATLADFIYARLLEYPNHYANVSDQDSVSKNL